ncbi:AbrB/MazE/SpoVT family DNA-binding domain-containing protein [Reyranella sp. CPCC 100927]|uniref:AbrB/MazE/SpoVT family DNA-binding domain-containing protein n=1 Tax=Reyranella sp. CPCC 100927 TaxID=2599616 RepID=UPI0011B7C77C|nr:AbrB/MazE/SpoVT family DNA-binding domain-containing protein [Reyranella sp. CPCC 100927]
MSTLTVSAKGQVTLRKDVLKHLGVQPGEKIIVENGPSLSIEEMNKITAGRR